MEEIPGRPSGRPFRVGTEDAEDDLLPRRRRRKGEEQPLLGGVAAPKREGVGHPPLAGDPVDLLPIDIGKEGILLDLGGAPPRGREIRLPPPRSTGGGGGPPSIGAAPPPSLRERNRTRWRRRRCPPR